MFLNFCILFFIASFAFLSIKKEKLSILLIILLLPTYLIRFKFFGIPTTVLEIMLISVVIGFLNKIIRYRINVKFSNFLLPIFLLLIASAIAVKISDNSLPALGIFKAYFLEPILFFIVFINNFKTKKDLNLIINTLGISVIYISVYAIFQKITGIGISDTDPSWSIASSRRVTSIFEYPNALGLFIAPIVVLFIGKIKDTLQNKKNRLNFIFNFLVIILGSLSVWFAKSEGGIVAIILSILFILFLYTKEKLKFILGFIMVTSILFFIPTTQKYLDQKIFLKDYSGKIRYQMWVETKNMLKDNLIFGAGLNNYQNKIVKYKINKNYETFLYPHNIILNFWSEIGLFGLLTFILIFYRFFQKCYLLKNKNKMLSIAVSASMFALIVHGLVDVPYFKNDLAILFWIIISLIIVLENINDNEIEIIEN